MLRIALPHVFSCYLAFTYCYYQFGRFHGELHNGIDALKYIIMHLIVSPTLLIQKFWISVQNTGCLSREREREQIVQLCIRFYNLLIFNRTISRSTCNLIYREMFIIAQSIALCKKSNTLQSNGMLDRKFDYRFLKTIIGNY